MFVRFIKTFYINGFTEDPVYKKQGFKSACCTGSDTFHEKCYCSADIYFCKLICDHDIHCKGFVGEGANTCQLATTSNCPTSNHCEKTSLGNNNDLDTTAKCGSGAVEGCYIKEKSKCTIYSKAIMSTLHLFDNLHPSPNSYYDYMIAVECEWSAWQLNKKCDKTCGGGKETYVRINELTNKLKAQGHTSCKKLAGREWQEWVIDCSTNCCKGLYNLIAM